VSNRCLFDGVKAGNSGKYGEVWDAAQSVDNRGIACVFGGFWKGAESHYECAALPLSYTG
jgi:hypothetical protein